MKTNIETIREEKGISRPELAKGVGVSRQAIYYIEKEKSNPSINLLVKIADFLGARTTELFVDEGK